jgi:hypothetical protein
MLLTLAFLAALHTVAPVDSINGSWHLKGDVAGNALDTVCELKQSGTSLTGACTNDKGEVQPITGQIADGKITFKHGGDYQGTELTITYSGKLETPTQLKGTIDVAPFSVAGTFTAEPSPAKK